jgi:4-amino-4-deoxy-L-arabinose transferase-like glycosyltransferase
VTARQSRAALLAVLALAAVLYGWNLSAAGEANSYYAAAILSGTRSWKAFFFGSLDAGSFITVDKPPIAFWLMGLSARIFGFSSWSMLLPQAAAGVATVGVLYAAVRRAIAGTAGMVAGLLAALVLTLTPMTVAIDRDNNPDTVLTLLIVLAAWALVRSLEGGRGRLILSMVLVGLAFNTKDLQAFIVLPALALAYLCHARASLRWRLADLLIAAPALVVSAGWWMVLVDSIPAGSRPYIGSSERNSVWNLVIGYNGLGRLSGGHRHRAWHGPFDPHAFATGASSGPTRDGFQGFGTEPGVGRMFGDTLGGQISWLIPFALLGLVAAAVLLRHGQVLLWGVWLGTSLVVYSLSKGAFHPYYTTTMAPAIGALTGLGAVVLFRAPRPWAWLLPAGLAVTGVWSVALLRRTPGWNPWLAWAVAGCAASGAVALVLRRRRFVAAGITVALAGALAGPAAYAVTPVGQPTAGANPLAGPAGTPMRRAFPAGLPGLAYQPGGRFGAPLDPRLPGYLARNQEGARWLAAVPNARTAATIILRTRRPAIAMGGFSGGDPAMTPARLDDLVGSGRLRYVLLDDRADPRIGGWVRQHCAAVPAAESGPDLYDCA